MSDIAPAASSEPLANGRAALLLLALLAAASVAAALTCLLPDNVYVRQQQARDSVMFHAAWVYERTHFDPAPIDVAIIGSSRLEAGISPTVLSQRLSARLGRPVHAANLSLVKPGRDYSYLVVRDLLDKHPETRVLVLANDGDAMFSHPMFKTTADARDVLGAPLLVNIKYFENVSYLPYRNLSYWAQSTAPRLFGVRTTFDRTAYMGTDLDRTLGYRAPTGEQVNGDQSAPAGKLLSESRAMIEAGRAGMLKYLNHLPPEQAQPGDRYYLRRIASLCRERGVRILFVTLPLFGGQELSVDRDFYRGIGGMMRIDGVAGHPDYYWNGGHLNRKGALVATDALASALAPLLAAPDGR